MIVAMLTMRIRSLAEHLSQNNRDKHSKRGLRGLVHRRAALLKYFKREEPARYEALLADCGLERRAVEGELIIR
jgi:small subunit ribosomal protein S15